MRVYLSTALKGFFLPFLMLFLFIPTLAFAQEGLDTGDTAWMLTSTVLVLMMTLPGLFLFYGGLVRAKNVLGTIMHSFVIPHWSACNGF